MASNRAAKLSKSRWNRSHDVKTRPNRRSRSVNQTFLYLDMFTLHDRRTGDLFDRWSEMGEKWRRLLDCSWAGVFRDHLLDDLLIDELLPHFDDRLGCPSKELHIVIGVLLLQQLHDLSDAATVEALAFNMAWHHALNVRTCPSPGFLEPRAA